MALILLVVLSLYLLYKWSISTFGFFEKQGIPFRKPLPLFGANLNTLFKTKSITENIDDWYKEFPNERFSGIFEFRRPIVFVRDPKLVKQLAVKDFDYFADHRVILTEEVDPMFGKALVSLKGQKWKDMRATLSPAFTGSKMRQMFQFVTEVGQQTAKSMRDEISGGGENSFEFKELSRKFTVDVIASCAFGIEVNSFKNPDNDFHRIAKKVSDFSSVKVGLKMLAFMTIPKIMQKLGISLLDKESSSFFEEAITETMKIREKKGIIRHDMINLLLQARKGQLAHSINNVVEEKASDGFATVEESQLGKSDVNRVWDDTDLAAQCFIFFLAGFDTIAQTMSFMAYELVSNPDIQQKLYEEVQEMNNELNGNKISYEQIQSLKYLDQVVSETLRKWPAAPVTDRLCVKDYDLKTEDGRTLHLKKNETSLFIPMWSFHRDPKYFPEPEKFKPERFSEENRGSIDPDTYIPFGVGPRNCIGSRFALMELKTIFYYFLLNFTFEANEKTQIPLKLAKMPFSIVPEKGVWLSLKPRDV